MRDRRDIRNPARNEIIGDGILTMIAAAGAQPGSGRNHAAASIATQSKTGAESHQADFPQRE